MWTCVTRCILMPCVNDTAWIDCVIAGTSIYMKCTLTGDKVLLVERFAVLIEEKVIGHVLFYKGKHY